MFPNTKITDTNKKIINLTYLFLIESKLHEANAYIGTITGKTYLPCTPECINPLERYVG